MMTEFIFRVNYPFKFFELLKGPRGLSDPKANTRVNLNSNLPDP